MDQVREHCPDPFEQREYVELQHGLLVNTELLHDYLARYGCCMVRNDNLTAALDMGLAGGTKALVGPPANAPSLTDPPVLLLQSAETFASPADFPADASCQLAITTREQASSDYVDVVDDEVHVSSSKPGHLRPAVKVEAGTSQPKRSCSPGARSRPEPFRRQPSRLCTEGPTKAASTATVLCGVSREKAQDEAAQVDS
ncbi:hypothetical protein CVIRNUC_001950 [Coccomyxa viridis]|uniref:Uncharacterized protein n=1 Tax=Coccomyxa viridis TaxID=1274662 RepID=A0AAV1HVJ8_9CHLO|nr:hypothetical protein CVIRNUC_001950 [Coccomyxa viridis]